MPAPFGKRFPSSLSHCLPLPIVMAILLCFGIASSSQAQTTDPQQNLDRLIQRFPDADANKDGKLTMEEAQAYLAAHPELRRNRQADGDGEATLKGDPARWEETIREFEATDAATPPPKGGVLLVGGSNARRWTDVSEYFPQHRVINRGFGGARLTDVLHYTDRIVLPYAPKTILLNAGGNDLSAGKTPEQIRDTARAFITEVHAALPETRIYYIGLPPVRRASTTPEGFKTIRALNALIAELARAEKNVEFIDLFPAFLDDKGQHRAELFVEDGTHFNDTGYQTLTNLLQGKF
jgi:lysophospholipase L1-like esterase